MLPVCLSDDSGGDIESFPSRKEGRNDHTHSLSHLRLLVLIVPSIYGSRPHLPRHHLVTTHIARLAEFSRSCQIYIHSTDLDLSPTSRPFLPPSLSTLDFLFVCVRFPLLSRCLSSSIHFTAEGLRRADTLPRHCSLLTLSLARRVLFISPSDFFQLVFFLSHIHDAQLGYSVEALLSFTRAHGG